MLSPGDRRQLVAVLAAGRGGQKAAVAVQGRAGVLVHPLPSKRPTGQHGGEGVCGRPAPARVPQGG